MWKISGLIALAMLSGCSATSLRCGVDGESSFVELYGTPQHMSQNMRQMGELCGFAYESESKGQTARLNIIDDAYAQNN